MTRPIRYVPSAPRITSVRPLVSSLKTAASQSVSSDEVVSIQPMSPPLVLDASVETAFASSSNVLPPLIAARASSAFFLAASFWASVGSVLPVSTAGVTAISQAWRSSLRVLSSTTRWSICSGVRTIPSSAPSFAWRAVSISFSTIVVLKAPCESSSSLLIAVTRDWASAAVRRPAAASALIRLASCWRRKTSTDARSMNWSFVIVWPSTDAAGARWALYQVVTPTITRMRIATTTVTPNARFV